MNLYTMVTRRTSRGTVMDAGQTLTMAEALSAFTELGAYVNKADGHRGRLMPGLAADVAVFSRDLIEADPVAVRDDTRCDLAILGGAVVHDALGETRHG